MINLIVLFHHINLTDTLLPACTTGLHYQSQCCVTNNPELGHYYDLLGFSFLDNVVCSFGWYIN